MVNVKIVIHNQHGPVLSEKGGFIWGLGWVAALYPVWAMASNSEVCHKHPAKPTHYLDLSACFGGRSGVQNYCCNVSANTDLLDVWNRHVDYHFSSV